MKALYFKALFICLLFAHVTMAQQNHFIYIQTDNKQPFYIKYDKKLLSSSASGYLIVPRLQEGIHNLIIGFPKNEWPEQPISVKVDDHDAGYSLKNFGEKGWGLFNMQTLQVTMAGAAQDNNTGKQPAAAIPQATPVVPVSKSEEQPLAKGKIQKIGSAMTNGGTEVVYLDISGGRADTVSVFIPLDKPLQKTEAPATTPVKETVLAAEAPKETISPVAEKPKPAEPVKSAPSKVAMINSDCKSVASEDDFLRLRKRMVIENNDDDMVSVARKVFKTKCFTTEQVKNLGALFLKDEGRYKLFDAAYPFVSDTQNFASLQAQLTNDYYISRFKAMVTH